jgi:hypothetical protein
MEKRVIGVRRERMVYQDSLETEGSLETLDQSESKASSDIL